MQISVFSNTLSGITPKLDVLSFDACLMSQMEVLYQLKDSAGCITASERTVPGYGYAYNAFLTQLNKNSSIAPLDYVKGIVSSYGLRYDGSQNIQGWKSMANATLAAIDTSKLGNLKTSLDNLAGLLAQQYSQKDKTFNGTMATIISNSWRADEGKPYTDIADFAQALVSNPSITSSAIKTAATSVVSEVKSAIVASTVDYFEKGVAKPTGYNGITILLFTQPDTPKGFYKAYTGLAALTTLGFNSKFVVYVLGRLQYLSDRHFAFLGRANFDPPRPGTLPKRLRLSRKTCWC